MSQQNSRAEKDPTERRSRRRMGCLVISPHRRRSHSEPPSSKRAHRQPPTEEEYCHVPPDTIPKPDDIEVCLENPEIHTCERDNCERDSSSDISTQNGEKSAAGFSLGSRQRKNFGNVVSFDDNLQMFSCSSNESSDSQSENSQNVNPCSSNNNNDDSTNQMHRNFSIDFNEIRIAAEEYASNQDLGKTSENSSSSSSSKLCFPSLCCYRKSRRKKRLANFDRFSYEEYLRLSQNSSEATTCSLTASSYSTDNSFVSHSTRSRTLQSLQSGSLSENLSHDSGFDELPCFLHLLMEDHQCRSQESCQNKKYGCLNAHLRNLVECMPKCFCDSEAKQHQPCGVQRGAGYPPTRRWTRRNAICETSVEMRKKFVEALCAFMTLQAMLKYDFI